MPYMNMTEIKVKMSSATIFERQSIALNKVADVLYGGNRSKLLTDLFDSGEYKKFLARRWKEVRKQWGVEE